MKLKSYLLIVLPFLAAACTDVRDTLGLTKSAPDEFVVVSRPPLSVPPDFELRPPSSQPGANRLAMPSTEDAAREALLGTSTATPAAARAISSPDGVGTPLSRPTSSFLNKAGASNAAPDIREQLNNKPAVSPRAGSLYERVVGKGTSEPVVDAAKEAERIRENKQQNKPLTEGETPDAPVGTPSVLDKIF